MPSDVEMVEARESRTTAKQTQDAIRRQQLDLLAEVGGRLVAEEDVKFRGTEFILPETCADLGDAIKVLRDRMEDEERQHNFRKTFKFRPYDGARATANAIRQAFGFTIGRPIITFFGKTPPEMIEINVGVDVTESVPWGAMAIPGLKDTTVYLGGAMDEEYGPVFMVNVEAPRKYRFHIEGLFKLIERNLREDSIYRGKVIDGAENPNFVDAWGVNPQEVVYTAAAMHQIEANIWSPIKHAEQLLKLGQPGKRSVLLEGPYGTGKTLAALLTAQVAEKHGWTFIMCRPGRDSLERTLQTARMYQPSVIFFEDLDSIAGEGGVHHVTKMLDMFDGLSAKGTQMLLVMTTNHVDRIHKGMVRPGRLDSVIHIGAMDRNGIEMLTRRVIGDRLADDVDFDMVEKSVVGYTPSYVREVFDRAVRYSVSANNGVVGMITTEDLMQAAEGLRSQLQLQEDASEHDGRPSVEGLITEVVRGQLEGAWIERGGSNFGRMHPRPVAEIGLAVDPA